MPDHFVRHVTTHAAGDPDAFRPQYALIAVMLATSLTCEYYGPEF